jgi:hypothetical protein
VDRIYTSSNNLVDEVRDQGMHISARRVGISLKQVVSLIALGASLASCGGGGGQGGPAFIPTPAVTTAALMNANDWEVGPIISGKNYSHNVPTHPIQDADGWHIDLPQSDGVHYVTRQSGSLAGKTKITIRYRVEMSDGVKIVPSSYPNAPALGPTLYFQRAGDDWNTDGWRWWATFSTPDPIVAGTFEISAPLDALWTSVDAKTATNSPSDFASAKEHAGRVGFTLGGGTGYGHGVFATGQARIVVTDFRID